MTPALLMELKRERLEHYEMLALPLDKLAFMYASAHNTGKYDDKGKLIEEAPKLNFEDYRTVYLRRGKTLAAKSTGPRFDHSLYGAFADRGKFEAWAGHKTGAIFIPTKEN